MNKELNLQVEYMKNDIKLVEKLFFTIENLDEIHQFCFCDAWVVELIIKRKIIKELF